MNKPHPRSPSIIRRPHLGSIRRQSMSKRSSGGKSLMRNNGLIERPVRSENRRDLGHGVRVEDQRIGLIRELIVPGEPDRR